MKLLHIDSSALGQHSVSRELTADIVAEVKRTRPDASVRYRDLAAQPLPHWAPVADASDQGALLGNEVMDEFLAADVIVLGAPMYNFGMPIQLKAWFDAIARAGVTFRYTENGPEGLLKNKKVYVATARGGIYPADADPQVPHIRMLLNFLGLTDHQFIYSAGLAMGPEAAAKGQAEADAAVAALA